MMDTEKQLRKENATASEQRYLRLRLVNFFELYAPSKSVLEVPRLLAEWADRPTNKLFEELVKEYGPEPPASPIIADTNNRSGSASSSYFQDNVKTSSPGDASTNTSPKAQSPTSKSNPNKNEHASHDAERRTSQGGFISYVANKASKTRFFGSASATAMSAASSKVPQTSFTVATELRKMSGFSIRPGNVCGWLLKNWETLNTWKQLFYVFDFDAHVMYECDSDDDKTPPRKIVSILTSRVADQMDKITPALFCFNLFVRGGGRGQGGDGDKADATLKIYKLGVQSAEVYELWINSLRRGLSSRSLGAVHEPDTPDAGVKQPSEAERKGASGIVITHSKPEDNMAATEGRGSTSSETRQQNTEVPGVGGSAGGNTQSMNALVIMGGRRYNLRCEPRSTNAWLLSEAIRMYMRENNNDDPGISGLLNTTQNKLMDLSEDVQFSYNTGDIIEAVVQEDLIVRGGDVGNSETDDLKDKNADQYSSSTDVDESSSPYRSVSSTQTRQSRTAFGNESDFDALSGIEDVIGSSSNIDGLNANQEDVAKLSPAMQRMWYRKQRGDSLGAYEANWEQQAEEEEAEEGRREEHKHNSLLLRTGSTGNAARGIPAAPWDTRGADAVADGWRTQVHQGELIGRGDKSNRGGTATSLLNAPWQSPRDRHHLLKYLRSHPGVSPNTHAAAQLVLEAMDPVMPFWLGYEWKETKTENELRVFRNISSKSAAYASTVVIPAAPPDVLSCIVDIHSQHLWDPDFDTGSVLDIGRSHDVVHMIQKRKWLSGVGAGMLQIPCFPRTFCLSRRWMRFADGSILVTLASEEHPCCPPLAPIGQVRAQLQGGFIIKPLAIRTGAEYSTVVFICELECGGWLPGFVEAQARERCVSVLGGIREHIACTVNEAM